MYLFKADGSQVSFDRERVIRTCMRVGVSRQDAEKIAVKVRQETRNGDTTRQVYKRILRHLKQLHPVHQAKYKLREAISLIEPHLFEVYAMRVLEAQGYACKWNVLVKGSSVEHQVDLIAQKDGIQFLVECKHHRNFHRDCGLGKVLQVQARLEDIQDGFSARKNKYDFSAAWMITNTKFSAHAIQYATAKKIKLTGWDYQKKQSLREFVTDVSLHPITVVQTNQNKSQLFRLMEAGILTVADFLKNKKTVLRMISNFEYKALSKKINTIM